MHRSHLALLFSLFAVLFTASSSGLGQSNPSPVAVSKSELETVTFSRVVVRFQDTSDIVVSGDQLRVRILEELRRFGYPALGAESLVFGKDEADQARMILGATATDIQCMPAFNGARRCQLSMVWEVLDRAEDQVVYRVMTRSVRESHDPKYLGEALIWGNFYSLLARPRFAAAFKRQASRVATYRDRASFARCVAEDRPMPASTKDVLAATVVVRSGNRIGTGVVISPDGFVLTAAHVVDPSEKTTAQYQGGTEDDAIIVRQDEHHDVALLRLHAGGGTPCLAIARADPDVGADVFAVGSPLSTDLSFSVTRGIVSGKRKIDGVELLQTDASVNRGNSGGPLVNATGNLVGVVSWKVAGEGVEGIAFGVLSNSVLKVLGIGPGDTTERRLLGEAVTVAPKQDVALDDAPDRDWREPNPIQKPAAPPPEESPPPQPVESGFEFGARFGYPIPFGKTVDKPDAKLRADVSGLIPLWVDTGYRFSPRLFLGIYVQYAIANTDCDGCSGTNLRGGLQGQFHIRPEASIDPWVGLGVGYEQLHLRTESNYTVDSTLTGPEWANLQIGADWRNNDVISFGPFISFSVGQYKHQKLDVVGPGIDYHADEDIDSVAMHQWLFLGIRGAATL